MATRQTSSVEQQASEIWKYLDNLSSSNPIEYERFIKKTLDEGKDELKPPEPCFCFKTYKVPKTIPYKAIFVNICSWQKVPTNGNELKSAIARDEIIENKTATIYDVYVNQSIIAKYSNGNKAFILLVLHYLENTTSIKLNRNYTKCKEIYIGNRDCLLDSILPNELRDLTLNKTKGKDILLRSNNIDEDIQDEVSLIEDHDKTKIPGKCLIQEISSSVYQEKKNDKLVTPSYQINYDQGYMTIIIELQGIGSIDDCIIDVKENQIHFESKEKYKLDAELSQQINTDTARAYFVKNSSNLLIKAQVCGKSL